MAFKFTKQEETRRTILCQQLTEARALLDAEILAESRIIEDAYAAINASVDRYNEALEEARGFIEDIRNEREGEYEDKSERWQEGERGEATRTWLERLEEAADSELEALEALPAELPEIEFDDHAEVLENIPDEPEY